MNHKLSSRKHARKHGPMKRRRELKLESLERRELLTVGPSTLTTPYVLPTVAGVNTTSLLSVGDAVPLTGNASATYRMVGIPDGLGAFDNGDGTFTLLMNHELGSGVGIVRAHGAKGAFVSEWIINKSDLSVVSGSDLMRTVYGWDTVNQATGAAITLAFNRFCSGDLPQVSAFFFDPTPNSPNSGDELGTTDRIYIHGEEGGATGYQVASVVTGPDAGKSYILGKFNLSTNGSGLTGIAAPENGLANPYPQSKTIVIAESDGGTGIMNNTVSVYVGTKTNSGSAADRAGLTNGALKFINVAGFADASGSTIDELNNTTTRTTGITSGTRFTLSGTSSTNFSRPEDGGWNPAKPNEFYFVTTDRLDQVGDSSGTQIGQTRLWRLTFDDITNPDLGGKIDLLIDGRVVNGQKVNMFDNVSVNENGHLILQEDVGNASHNGKVWDYDPVTDTIVQIAKHDPARFGDVGLAATSPFNIDEETSGVIDVSSILGPRSYLLVDQAHYPIDSGVGHNVQGFSNPDELVEGGQLILLRETPKVSFLAVGAGNTTSSDAVLWTRAQDFTRTTGVALLAQVSVDSTFASGLATFAGLTDPAHDYTIHLHATGLQAGTRYFYRFVADDNTVSPAGTFVTAPSATANVPVRFGFTGDADGLMRPYDATQSADFAAPGSANFGQSNFDYFIWLGDTIYETASGTGTPNFSPVVNLATPNLAQYWNKYREQFLPVSTGPYDGLTSFFSSTGHYTVADNHELGNQQFINGGAPAAAPTNSTDTSFDVNVTGTYKHNTSGYQTLQQAYRDYQPLHDVQLVSAPSDPRSDGTQKLYFSQQWGANSMFFNVDDRTNRDIRLRKVSGTGTADDTGDRADNPGRTMLGSTELAWLQNSLVAAQQQGVVWKIVATSSPIDQIGAIGSGADGGKSWIGGYRTERNALMKFIDDNDIDHVVFFSTDDHLLRVNELGYFTQFTTNSLGFQAPVQSSYTRVPGAISIVAGPIGATGPDTVTNHAFSNIQSLADALAASEIASGVDPIGLDSTFPGLRNIKRDMDGVFTSVATAAPVDFYSPDTFNYATLDISADGSTLTVGVKGINSYAANSFPQPSAANAVRDILSFQLGLQTTKLTVPTTQGVFAGTTTLTATLTDSVTNAPISGKLVTFKLGNTVVGTAITAGNGVVTLSNVDTSAYSNGSYGAAIQASFHGDVSTLKSAGAGTLVVTNVVLGPDPSDPSLTALFVGGTAKDDQIHIKARRDGKIEIEIKSHRGGSEHAESDDAEIEKIVSGAVSRVIVFAGSGNDHVEISKYLTLPALVFGGAGNDLLKAGGGPTVLIGGTGDDQLAGGTASDILIGGLGSDKLKSSGDSDILIAGTTDFDANLVALDALAAEWGRADETVEQKVANLQNTLVGTTSPNGTYTAGYFLTSATVHDDGVGNTLLGRGDVDWFFANLDGVGNNGIKDKISSSKPLKYFTKIVL